jgi:hypothetical protein
MWWGAITVFSKLSPRNSLWLGPLIYAFDKMAMLTGAAPSTKFVLLSRLGSRDSGALLGKRSAE